MFRIVYLLAVVIFFFVDISMAGPIPTSLKEIVTFIFVLNKEGRLVPNGTGFFIGVRNEANPALAHVYLVTAKHVLQDETGKLYPTVWMRLNRRQTGADFVRINLVLEGQKRVYTHPDGTVDIAVIPGVPDETLFAFKFLPDEFLTTKESFRQLKIAEGSEVFFTGLFIAHYGQQKNSPIVRFGRVAMVSDERVFWKEETKQGEMVDLYLIEAQSFGGNSGSPVFFHLGSDREPGALIAGPPVIKLAGIVRGSFNQGLPIRILETGRVPVSMENLGIAAVTPSYLLHEILFSEELKKERSKAP